VCARSPFPTDSGGRKRIVRLAEAMERAGAVPHIVTLHDEPEGAEASAARGWGYETFALPGPSLAGRVRQHGLAEVLPSSAEVRAHVRRLAPASAWVQLEEIYAAQYVHAVAGLAPTVVSLHNVDSRIFAAGHRGLAARHRYRALRMARVERRAVRRADAVLCVSHADREHFRGLGARDALLAPNGVDDDLFGVPEAVPEGERVLFFGTLSWRPNIEGVRRFVADAWPGVRARRPAARLRIAGPRSREHVGDLHAPGDGVEVLGVVEDLAAELAATRVVVAPLWIGGGTRIKVLEAMAAARPVVGTAVGVEQIGFRDGVDGLVADDPAGLAAAVAQLLEDDALAARCASAARAAVQSARWSSTTAPAEALYRRWLAAG
jgi:glycosyltransferase involved in cell wall biosynthesis